MTARVLTFVFLLSALTGCGDDDSCPAGTQREEGVCVAADSGIDSGTPDSGMEDGGPVCEPACMDGEVCHEGECVECTSNADCTELDTACDTRTNTCVSYATNTARACEPCLADAQCEVDLLCVPMTFRGEVYGRYCAWRQEALTNVGELSGSCSAVPPYVDAQTLESADGRVDVVCTLRSSTCDAHDDFARTACTPGATPSTPNEACGVEGLDDGFCVSGANRCTVECASGDDCPCIDGACVERAPCAGGFCALST